MRLAHLVVDLALTRLSPERLTMIKNEAFPPFLLRMDSIPFEAILNDWVWREQEIPLSENEAETGADQRDPIFVDNVVVISATSIEKARP